MKNRCPWCGTDSLYVQYHDEEWGVPIYDSRKLFAKLILDGAQAGLSWITILRKRENYYRAFDGLNPDIMATYGEEKVAELLQNAGIVRNRQKIWAAVRNAQAYVRMREAGIDFGVFLWQFVNGRPVQNAWRELSQLPAQTPASEAMSKALKQHGFSFVGPTICYAFMQAVGMVNDHLTSCFRYEAVRVLSG